MIEKQLEFHEIMVFTRLMASLPSSDDGFCGCNAACGCVDKPSCCEQKCGCFQKTLVGDPGDDSDGRVVSLLADPTYSKIISSFDPKAVGTISDFLGLADRVRDQLKG
jgi:hypothetical protein